MLAVVARFASKINHYIRAMMKKTILYLAHAALRWILLVFGGWCGAALAADGVPRSALANAHIGVAVLVAGIFVAAFLLALTLLVQARRLRSADLGLVSRLPAVLVLERMLFRVLTLGFGLLTLLILSGMFFGEQVWGRSLIFNHKVVLTLWAWLVFAVLLAGRYVRGWRGLTAVRATIFGFALLFLAYVGTHFVLDVILKR
jgi:ABC-type uncharacterized transport system permease subunit